MVFGEKKKEIKEENTYTTQASINTTLSPLLSLAPTTTIVADLWQNQTTGSSNDGKSGSDNADFSFLS